MVSIFPLRRCRGRDEITAGCAGRAAGVGGAVCRDVLVCRLGLCHVLRDAAGHGAYGRRGGPQHGAEVRPVYSYWTPLEVFVCILPCLFVFVLVLSLSWMTVMRLREESNAASSTKDVRNHLPSAEAGEDKGETVVTLRVAGLETCSIKLDKHKHSIIGAHQKHTNTYTRSFSPKRSRCPAEANHCDVLTGERGRGGSEIR